MEALTSFSQLQSRLIEAEHKQLVSDDEFRQSLAGWYLSPTIFGEIPDDPFGPTYRAFQLRIYESLAQKPYDVANEDTAFDFDHEIQWPYPYGTRSAETVGTHLMGYGWLIKVMDLPAGSRILEIGSGFGALTVHLASMGYRVTCLDISSRLLRYVRARTTQLPQQVEILCGDMATVEINHTFDAVVFNASLHHSLEHRAVITRLDELLAPDGIAAFAAEPVVSDQSTAVPYPWGVRLDGRSVWSISRWGWMELGFQESYFVQLLEDAGWHLTRYSLGVSGTTDVWTGNRTGRGELPSSGKPQVYAYGSDLAAELTRLKTLVEGYEAGRFIRLMKWLRRSH